MQVLKVLLLSVAVVLVSACGSDKTAPVAPPPPVQSGPNQQQYQQNQQNQYPQVNNNNYGGGYGYQYGNPYVQVQGGGYYPQQQPCGYYGCGGGSGNVQWNGPRGGGYVQWGAINAAE